MKHFQRAKREVSTIRLVKHVERSNFPMIFYSTAKNLLGREYSKDLVQLSPEKLIKGKPADGGDLLRWCG